MIILGNFQKQINHPGIVKIYEIYENEYYLHIVMEYLEGGELMKRLKERGAYTEKDASSVMRSILEGLDYCHSFRIAHRDLKLENIILVNPEKNYEVKIADFGFAIIINNPGEEKMKCGFPGYVAPEILNGHPYDCKADIFSAGIILYSLLVGHPPFQEKTMEEQLALNRKCEIAFPESEWKNVSPEALDLVKKLLEKDPGSRPTAKEALEYPWFFMEHIQELFLSTAQLSVSKYNDEKRLNLSRSKPDFSLLTCTPLLSSKFANVKNFPLLLSGSGCGYASLSIFPELSRTHSNSKLSQNLVINPCQNQMKKARGRGQEEAQNEKVKEILIRSIQEKYLPPGKATAVNALRRGKISIPHPKDESCNFEESNISEKCMPDKNPNFMKKAANRLTSVLPLAPGFSAKNCLTRIKTPGLACDQGQVSYTENKNSLDNFFEALFKNCNQISIPNIQEDEEKSFFTAIENFEAIPNQIEIKEAKFSVTGTKPNIIGLHPIIFGKPT